MSLEILIALYVAGLFGALAYYVLLPQQQAAFADEDSQHLVNLYTTGTGNLEDCLRYTFRVMVNQEKVNLPKRQVNVICNPAVPRELLGFGQRGILLAR